MKDYMRLLTILGLLLVSYTGWAKELPKNIAWHWEDHFTPVEKEKLVDWLEQTTEAVQSTLGTYPFTIHFYMHRRDYANEPVPWAHTSRGSEQAVHFHVDPNYELKEFLADWTAPHEISHLSIPFLGKENSWFAEGYATYLQCQVMYTMGEYNQQSLKAEIPG